MFTLAGVAVYVAVHVACVIGNALALIAAILCLRKKKNGKAAIVFWLGGIATLLGASVMLLSDRPLPSYEKALFYQSAVPVLLGITSVVVEIYKNRKTTQPCATANEEITRMKDKIYKFCHGISWLAVVLTAIASLLWVAIIVTQDGWGTLFYIFLVTPWVGGGALVLGLIPSGILYAHSHHRRDLRSIWLSGASVLLVAAETAGLFVYPTHAC